MFPQNISTDIPDSMFLQNISTDLPDSMFLQNISTDLPDSMFLQNISTDLPDSTVSYSKQCSQWLLWERLWPYSHHMDNHIQTRAAQIFFILFQQHAHISEHVQSMVRSW